MQKIKWPIILVSIYVFFYLLAFFAGLPDDLVIGMYFFAPVAVVWMVIKVLQNGIPSERNFDEYFYEDWDYKRNTVGNL